MSDERGDPPPSIQGIGVSTGLAVGPAVQFSTGPGVPVDEPPCLDPSADWARISLAIEEVAAGFERAAAAASSPARDILAATALMTRDRTLATGIRRELAAGAGPATSVSAAVEQVCAMLTAAGGAVADRTTDLRDVGQRLVGRLLGWPPVEIPDFAEPGVLVARDLAPADTVALPADRVLAIVIEAGGPTSHTAILAAELGIPAVVQAHGATAIAPGTRLAVDGSAGTVTVAPTAAAVAHLRRRQHDAPAPLATRGPGRTADGHRVALLVNVGTVADAEAAGAGENEGVGLFRTEFLFLDRTLAPTEAEQEAAYTRVFAAFAGRPVIVRTLDGGADKPLGFAPTGSEPNPALGRRGIRLTAAFPALLEDQLTALAAAAATTGAEIRVMAPMVATAAEAVEFAARVRSHGLVAGAMIEVPAAALRSEAIVAAVDFVSIGTNDLSQYAMAADRQLGELAHLLDPWQPAVLDLVARAAGAAATAGKPIGICGESAGDPWLALVYVGLGVTSLSMAASRLPAVRAALAEHSRASCRAAAAAALAADAPDRARADAQALLGSLGE